MTHRSYKQYCTLAHALDLIGDRWALLIIRDLILGPKRSIDLIRLLPGIGTNILYDRLKGLEKVGVIRRRLIPPPTPATLYELTDYGRQLEGPIAALSAWGAQSFRPGPDAFIRPESIMLNLRALFLDRLPNPPHGTYEIRVDDLRFNGVFTMRVDDDGVAFAPEGTDRSQVTLGSDVATIVALGQGRLALPDAVRSGALQIDGVPSAVADLLARDAETSTGTNARAAAANSEPG